MVWITQQPGSDGAKKHFATPYYLSVGQENVGSWASRGARLLGLQAVLDKASFERGMQINPGQSPRILFPLPLSKALICRTTTK